MDNNEWPRAVKLSWLDVRSEVAAVNPHFAELVDSIDPGPELPIYRARYAYGEQILDGRKVTLPAGTDPKFREAFQSEEYAWLLSLNKVSELFLDLGERSVPLRMFSPGDPFVILKNFGVENDFCNLLIRKMTAGARTIFMLPKVTDSKAHKRLWQTFQTPFYPPNSPWEHWQTFSVLANHESQATKWYSDILLFPKEWSKFVYGSVAADRLRLQFHDYIWKQTTYLRVHPILTMLWARLTLGELRDYASSVRPNLVDTAKHLLAIGMGAVPGLQAAGRSELVAPISMIEKAYIDIYELKHYLPIILHPTCTDRSGGRQPSYYSLSLPTMLETNPEIKLKHPPNIINEVRDVVFLMERFIHCIQEQCNASEKVPLDTRFRYFHTHSTAHREILLTTQMPELDPALMRTSGNYVNRTFPAASPFVRGCVQILTATMPDGALVTQLERMRRSAGPVE